MLLSIILHFAKNLRWATLTLLHFCFIKIGYLNIAKTKVSTFPKSTLASEH